MSVRSWAVRSRGFLERGERGNRGRSEQGSSPAQCPRSPAPLFSEANIEGLESRRRGPFRFFSGANPADIGERV
jgi:hypothetical protein